MEAGFEILVLSPEEDIANEAEILNRLFKHELNAFHLRKRHWSFEQTEKFFKAIPAEFHNRIVLHSHFELTNTFEVRGIHLNEANKKLIQQFEQYPIISASFHTLNDIQENTFPYRYIFLSPVFDSISKAGYNSKFDLNLLSGKLESLKSENSALPKVIALGGINAENILKVRNAGFSGAAILGAVWQSSDPFQAFDEIKSKVEAK